MNTHGRTLQPLHTNHPHAKESILFSEKTEQNKQYQSIPKLVRAGQTGITFAIHQHLVSRLSCPFTMPANTSAFHQNLVPLPLIVFRSLLIVFFSLPDTRDSNHIDVESGKKGTTSNNIALYQHLVPSIPARLIRKHLFR
jgi:hypothetical protein